MSSFRSAIRFFFVALALAIPVAASASTFEVKAYIDSDNHRDSAGNTNTGCSVVSSAGVVSGVEYVVTTFGTINGNSGTVSSVTRQTCTGGILGAPVTVDGGWNVGVSSIGDLTIESRLGADLMTMDNVISPRFVFTSSLNAGTLTDTLLTPFTWGGGDIILPHAARDRAVATRPLRTIVTDGNGAEWLDGEVPVAFGTDHSPSWRFISAQVYPGAHDLYFNFQIHTNSLAPTAHDDTYPLPDFGATLTINSALGVLHNDDPNNNQPISATLVGQPHHGTVTLSSSGAFTYVHDGSHVQQDQFTYVVTGSPLLSNVGTVTITMPGNNPHPYTFTSPDHVTFVAGQFNTFQVVVTGHPTPALSEDGALPQVVGFVDNGDGTGTLSGVPAASAVGTYQIVFHAEKNKPHQSDQNFTLTVSCPSTIVTNPIVTTGVAGTPFSQTFTASGGQAPYAFSLISGTLPAGMTLHPSGVLDGTPAGPAGTFPIVVRATDANGCPGDGPTYTLTISCQTITVTNPATTTGTANAPFSQTFTQAGAVSPVFSLNSGTLPAGLTLSSAGVLSGTPTQTGSFPITVKVTSSNSCTGISPTYNLTINCQTITVTNPATNTGVAGAAFSKTFTQSGSIGTATFSINSGTLPTGLTLSSAGVLSGTPTQTGSFPITVKVTDSNGCTGVGATYTITITCQTVTVTNPSTTTGTVSAPFSQTFTQSGGIGTMTFTLASGSLPAGLTLSSSGVLSGSPTVTGSFPITVKATDSNGCNGTGSTYTLVISCQTITVTNPSTTTGTVSTPFSQSFTQTSAVGGATFTLNSGTLPTGLTLSSAGVLSGTPTQNGSFPITVKVTDGNGCTGIGATYTLVINCQVITVTNPATTTGTAGAAFSQTFTQAGGVGTLNFSIVSGTLPTGMTFHSGTGVLDGTPTQTGSFPLVVRVTDINGCTGDGPTYNLFIACQTITVTNPVTSTGVAGSAFSQTFTQSGAIGTTTFTLASGTLPTGLTLSSAGVLSGTPLQTGSFPITVMVTDGNNCTGTGATYNLNITCQTITVTNPATTTGTAGSPFSQTFTQSGAIGGATFTVNSGSLPTGLTLSSAGVLSGTPTVVGSFPITVKVTDGNNCTGISASYPLVIGCQTITVTNPATTTGTVNAPFSQTFTQSGAIGTATFTLNTGTLPAGLSLSAAGVLSGTPTVNGTFPITVKVTDGNGCTGVSATYNLVINCQTITVTNPGVNTGTVGVAFSQTFTQTGAQGTATFTTASTLPTGFTLSTTGVLSGTTNQHTSFPIVVTVTDSNGCTGTSATYTLIISCQTITVTNPSSSSSPAGTPLPPANFTFTQSGSIGGATFTTASTLPTGVSLTTAGVLTGTPTQGGSFPIVVTVTDGNGCTGTNPSYTLTITCPTITVTNPGVSTGTAGTAFSQTFTQTGGQGTITWSIFSGVLPAGMTFHPTTGVLDGTPTQTGSFPLVIRATDSNGCTGDGPTYTLVIACQTITVTNPVTATGTVNAPFSQTFTQSGAIGGATFSLNSGSLPAGLTLSAAGVLSGTPTQSGSFPITVKVTDGNNCTGVGATYTLVIACQTITVTNPSSSTGTIQVALTPAASYTFTASNTIGAVTFTLNSGSLPAGVTLSSAGVLTGTPTVTGSFPITVKATDANGCFGVSSTYTLVINCQTITVTNPAATTATVGTNFSDTFAQTGANGTATFTLNTGSLPTGITLAPNGAISGIPTQSGSFPITVKVTDSNGCTGISPTYTLVVSCQTITVTNPATNTATVGTAFSQTFTQTGGIGTITWSKTGAIPTGMTFHTTTGVLDGTPTQSGSFPITVTATDQNGCSGTGPTYTLTVACNIINVTNPGVTTGTVDAAFSQSFGQTGANGTATFTLNSGSLPAGFTLSSAGVLSGTPGAPGSFSITVKVTDSNGCTGISPTYNLVIGCQTITVTNPGVTTGTVDTPFSQTFTQTGVGTHTPATFTINSGSLTGTGLTLSSAGVLSGTPSAPGSIAITVKVTDANGCTGISSTYTLVIACQTITVTNPATASGVFNAAFSQTFTQTGVGTHTPATFTINSGTLPTGLSLSTAGVLSGTPTQTGTFPITVKVTDANGCTGIGATYNLAVNPNLGTDAYGTVNALVDNTQAFVTGGTTATPGTPAVQLSGSVLANDLPAGGVTVTAGTFGTTAGGSVTIQTDGTFLYTPKANPGAAATTSDSFTYTGTSNTGATATPTSATGTVNLTLLGRVWYVKNNGGGTNGQSQSPFTTLAAAAAASTANDIIFVYNGDGTNSGQNAGITLKSGQQLLGEINSLTVNTFALVSAGSRPTIGNSGGDGVTVPATAGSLTAVFIKGLSIAGTANGINLSSSGANTLTATVDNVVITAATANNGIKVAAAGTLTSTVTIQNSVVNAATQNGIDAQQTTAGNLVLNINNNNVTATGTGINVNGAGSTSTTITNFASNTIGQNTVGSGITVTSATFDGTPGGAFQTVSGGNTVIGIVGNGVGASGMVLTNVAGDLSFTDLDIVSSNGAGLSASGTTPYTGSAGFQIAVAAGVATIDATGGPAASLTTVTANLPFVTIKSANSTSTGVNLVTVPGTFTAGSGSSISNATGTDFNINGSNATVTYDGTITDSTSSLVTIASTTGGTKTFTGAISDSGSGTGQGISLTNNTGATINFTGQLTLTTGGSAAFTATGGGTVSSSNTNSTIVTTTGTAINVANTTIGAANLKFKSVAAGTAASGPANAIIVNNTGASGSLIIAGTGSAGSGGTLQKTTGFAILLTSTKGIDLSFMNIQNSTGGAISGTSVNGFSLTSCSITGNAGGVNDGQTAAVILTDTTNAVSFVSDTVTGTTGANAFNAELHSSAASTAAITTLTVTGGSYSNSAANGGFLIDTKNTAKVGAAFFSGVTFNNNFSKGLQMAQNDNAILGDSVTAPLAGWGGPPNGSITITGCTFVGNNVAAELDGGTGAANASGSTYYRFVNNGTAANPIVGIPITTPGTGSSHALVFANGSDSGGGSYKAFISGNFLGSASQVASGKGNGMRIFMQGQQSSTVTVVNNSVLNCPIGRGIEVSELGRPGAGFGQTQLNIKLTGNTVNPMDSTGFPLYAIYVGADAQGTGTSGSSVAAEIHGNTVPATAGCDTQCGPSISMIAYETVSGATGTHTGTLFQTGPGGSVSADISATNTGTAGKSSAYVNGGSLTLTGVAPPTVN